MIYILGIGSNLKSKYGSKIQTLRYVIRELEKCNIRILKKSYIYSSPPKYFKKAGDTFVNAALMVSSEQSPEKLLYSLKILLVLHRDEIIFCFLVLVFLL